jgi:hypothetical protein
MELLTKPVCEPKCSCLPCRQDRVRDWVGKLLDWGVPAENITMEINQYGGKVVIYSGNEELKAHHKHKEKWCYQFNERSLEFAKTWWLVHHNLYLLQQQRKGEK